MTERSSRHERHDKRRSMRPSNTQLAAAAITIGALAVILGIGIALVSASMSQPATSFDTAANQPASAIATPTVEATLQPEPEPEPTPEPEPLILFDASNALAEVRTLEAFGVRKGGSAAEARAADWIRGRLSDLGYAATLETVPLPNGTESHNVIAQSPGASPRVIVLGAHMDSKAPSPGANDNGTGCGALLEIARILASQPVTPTVEFVFFGTEEMIDKDPSHHHYGSRYRVEAMSEAERDNTAGMVSVDMIGYGPDFHSRTMLKGPQTMSDFVLKKAAKQGIKMSFLKDAGSTGWSDQEAYELAGIPATWIEWRDDPVYHTAKDTSAHLDVDKVQTAGQLVLDVLRSLDERALEKLVAR